MVRQQERCQIHCQILFPGSESTAPGKRGKKGAVTRVSTRFFSLRVTATNVLMASTIFRVIDREPASIHDHRLGWWTRSTVADIQTNKISLFFSAGPIDGDFLSFLRQRRGSLTTGRLPRFRLCEYALQYGTTSANHYGIGVCYFNGWQVILRRQRVPCSVRFRQSR